MRDHHIPAHANALPHGGRLRAAAQAWNMPLCDWLDLSTGINPEPWAGLAHLQLPASAWTRLPEPDDGLITAAQRYYGTAALLPVAGSQAAIQALPRLRAPCRVCLPQPAYAEHEAAWRAAGHEIIPWPLLETSTPPLADCDVLVLLQPNNPSGHVWPTTTLLDWHAHLAARDGWLVVDEAFGDATPELSVLSACQSTAQNGGEDWHGESAGARGILPPGLIVLRSLGKFFGLAGARVGCVCAAPALLAALDALLGPWALNGPARLLAQAAYADSAWQADMRQHLPRQAARLAALLTRHGLPPEGGTALFQWLRHPQAQEIHAQLARRAILVRLFAEPASLRFGLPGAESDWQRLDDVLGAIMPNPAPATAGLASINKVEMSCKP